MAYIVPLILVALVSIYLLRQFWSASLASDDVSLPDDARPDTPQETLRAA